MPLTLTLYQEYSFLSLLCPLLPERRPPPSPPNTAPASLGGVYTVHFTVYTVRLRGFWLPAASKTASVWLADDGVGSE